MGPIENKVGLKNIALLYFLFYDFSGDPINGPPDSCSMKFKTWQELQPLEYCF